MTNISYASSRRHRRHRSQRPQSTQQWCYSFDMGGISGVNCFPNQRECVDTREADASITQGQVTYTVCAQRN